MGYYHIALEPSTGRPDNLDVAVNQWKNYASLEPKADVSWTTKIFRSDNVKRLRSMTAEEGIIE